MTIEVCDFHPKTIRATRRISLFKERKMDAAGSMDNEYETFDLCAGCMATLIHSISDSEQSKLAVQWSSRLRKL